MSRAALLASWAGVLVVLGSVVVIYFPLVAGVGHSAWPRVQSAALV